MDIKKIIASLAPFFLIGIAIALCAGLLLMFFSVAIFGLMIGAVLWLVALAKQYFFPNKPPKKTTEGHIIEHNYK